MITTYILLGIFIVLFVSNFLIYKTKISLIKALLSLFISLLYLFFVFFDNLKEYEIYYSFLLGASIILSSLFYFPKKITKNLTEYDFSELEVSYDNLKSDRELLRQRYLKTIDIIDEGIIFYENKLSSVILSDKARKILGGAKSSTFSMHSSLIIDEDREEYARVLNQVNAKNDKYEIKYRIKINDILYWIYEKGRYINSKKGEIIASVKCLDIEKFSKTSYYILDSMCNDETLYPIMSNLLSNHIPFTFILFELSNVPEINSKYGRLVGSFVMNEFIKYIEENFQKDVLKVYRLTGLRFGLIIHDEEKESDFFETLYTKGTNLNTFKIDVVGINDELLPNYGIIKVKENTDININDLLKLSIKTLNEAIDSKKRNYSVLGE